MEFCWKMCVYNIRYKQIPKYQSTDFQWILFYRKCQVIAVREYAKHFNVILPLVKIPSTIFAFSLIIFMRKESSKHEYQYEKHMQWVCIVKFGWILENQWIFDETAPNFIWFTGIEYWNLLHGILSVCGFSKVTREVEKLQLEWFGKTQNQLYSHWAWRFKVQQCETSNWLKLRFLTHFVRLYCMI